MKIHLLPFLVFTSISLCAQVATQGRAFVIGSTSLDDNKRDSYIVSLQEEDDIAYARQLIEVWRRPDYKPGLFSELGLLPMVVVNIYRGSDSINGDYISGLTDPSVPHALPTDFSRWNWNAEFLRFTDASPEILDSWPSYIESNLDTWISVTHNHPKIDVGGAAFWGYTIVGELPLQFTQYSPDGWRKGWFGWFWDFDWPWVWRKDTGWFYLSGLDPFNIWMYHPTAGWLWTSETVYPHLWKPDEGWIFHNRNPDTPKWYWSYEEEVWKKF